MAVPTTAERHAVGKALGGGENVRFDATVFQRKQLAGTGKAGLHFVGDQQNAVLVAQGAQRFQVIRRGDVEAAFALYRLDHDGRRAVRGDIGFEQRANGVQRSLFADAVQRIRNGARNTSPGIGPKSFL